MDNMRGGFWEGPFLQEKCMRSDLLGLKDMPIKPRRVSAQSRVAESRMMLSDKESKMTRKLRLLM